MKCKQTTASRLGRPLYSNSLKLVSRPADGRINWNARRKITMVKVGQQWKQLRCEYSPKYGRTLLYLSYYLRMRSGYART